MANSQEQHIKALLARYASGEVLADNEAADLGHWLHEVDADGFAAIAKDLAVSGGITEQARVNLEAKLDAVDAQQEDGEEEAMPEVQRIHFIRRFKWIAAALILFAFAGGAWFWFMREPTTDNAVTASVYKNDVAPGKKGGKLKLSNNKILPIDSLKEGFVTMDAGMAVYKENGQIVYKGTATKVAYNEIIEETGRYTSAELPDHSIAWVGSNSSIRYPLHFAANERAVTMTGQASFRVKHNEQQPFRVYVGDLVFEDKGTEFNIRAYKDEPVVKTTVMDGLVSYGKTIIKPNEQAQVGKNGQVNVTSNVNVESVFAWRDGEFTFSNASINEIMNEAAKWYGIEVVYKDQIDQRFGFVGIDRNMPISNLLKNLETIGGVHFEVEGNRVTIKK
jgi:ferric-dicitrate binding protein FerR (iron transport regulator)